MYESINRYVLIIKPKKPLLDWVNYIFPENPVTLDSLGKHDYANVFLIPDYDHIEDAIVFLKENYIIFLEEELFGWCEDEKLWPEKRDWQLFEGWLDYEINSMVMDVVEGPIMRKEF
jgi:hypothetical protein